MIGLIATFQVKPGQEDIFEDIVRELMAQVKANEPGALVYQLFKSPAQEGVYMIMEQYSSREALEAHGRTEYMARLGTQMTPCLAGRPHLQLFDMVE